MADLPVEDRQRVWRGLMRLWSANREAVAGIVKTDLQNAVDYTDTWIDTNQAAWNSGLPTAAKNNLTMGQKTILFCAVAAMRVGVGFLRALIGQEVD